MPLDSHGYLVSQGWKGKGSALRTGAISRPIAIPQKRTLAGVGKDRDEAFPFWDHLFTAASSAIKIKVSDDEDHAGSSSMTAQLQRTTTGIISNRRPVAAASPSGTSAVTSDTPDTPSQYSLLVTAKRRAAKQRLYARFFQGPVLTSEESDTSQDELAPTQESDIVEASQSRKKKRKLDEDQEGTITGNKPKRSKSKSREQEADTDSSLEKAERKRIKKEAKEAKRKAKELALSWMQNSQSPTQIDNSVPKKKRRKDAASEA